MPKPPMAASLAGGHTLVLLLPAYCCIEVTGISFRSPLLQAPEIHADAGAALAHWDTKSYFSSESPKVGYVMQLVKPMF